MGSYLILDAYNLIGALKRYQNIGSLEEAREMIVGDALKAAGWTGHTIIVVFDAHRSPEPRRTDSRAGGVVRVIYSAAGESADDVIERLLDGLDGRATVYTADFALQRITLARGAARATPREFQELLDEMPAISSFPRRRRRSRLLDHLSEESRQKLEELRRRTDGS